MNLDPFTPYLKGNQPIRVAATKALPSGKGASIPAPKILIP